MLISIFYFPVPVVGRFSTPQQVEESQWVGGGRRERGVLNTECVKNGYFKFGL